MADNSIYTIIKEQYGNWASVAGLIISIVGFIVTVFASWKAKLAAEDARMYAKKTQESLLRKNAIAELSESVSIITDIKNLHLANEWKLVRYQYEALRKILNSVSSLECDLQNAQKRDVQRTIQLLLDFDKVATRYLTDPVDFPDVGIMNQQLSKQQDKINQILAAILKHMDSYNYEK